MLADELTKGVVIGLFLGFRDDRPLVVFPSNPGDEALAARSLCTLTADDAGSEVALLFEDGRDDRPLIIGRILEDVRGPAQSGEILRDDDAPMKITSRDRLELRCGKASIVMKADGSVTIRGTQILSRAERANRVQGATVNLN